MPPNRQLSLLRSLAVSHGQLTMLRFVAPPDSYLYEPWFVFVQNLMRICCDLNFTCLSSSQSILIPKALDSNCKNQLPTSDNFKWLIALICFASKLLKFFFIVVGPGFMIYVMSSLLLSFSVPCRQLFRILCTFTKFVGNTVDFGESN